MSSDARRLVYHFISDEWALDNLARRRLKVATYGDLNDPFEGRAVAIRDPATRRNYASFHADWGRRRGLLCFSRDWRNPVQWSHYSSRHRGLCLAFNIPESLAVPVEYRRRPYPDDVLTKLDTLPDAEAERLMQSLLVTKYSHWRYEQEVRMFVELTDPDPENGLHFEEFSSDLALVEVIVGYKSEITQSDLNAALGSIRSSVTTKKARLSFQTYRVVRQRDPSMWPA
ncbi:MAG: hypothetical protein BGN86_13355 [Caulobacterales bacterium 68-7]|nr:MAG: hypothetical protein BGN86_13355 [Caulobacterales bacterium 68-7]